MRLTGHSHALHSSSLLLRSTTKHKMFARTSTRTGVRFASGNVFYMGRTFTARHMVAVFSPLSAGHVTSLRLSRTGRLQMLSGDGSLFDKQQQSDVVTTAERMSAVEPKFAHAFFFAHFCLVRCMELLLQVRLQLLERAIHIQH
jgi:hypothetical protein